ncbi:MAG: triose-phosphate isomerase, partial [Candidatus Aminicenantes bacterium]
MTITNEKPFIAGNWKMYKTIPEAVEMVKALKEASSEQIEA